MDFPKYLSLLDKESLFFSNVTKLYDKFEGALPKSNADEQKIAYEKLGLSKELSDAVIEHDANFKKLILVNCWNMNNEESDLMWKSYVKDVPGIAIQSTFKKLASIFSDNPDVHLGIVRYIDHYSDKIKTDNFYHKFLHKRKYYSDERELRAITHYKTDSNPISQEEMDSIRGRHIKIDLKELIEKIYVSPTSPEWFLELTESVSKKFGIDKPVEKSPISMTPDY